MASAESLEEQIVDYLRDAPSAWLHRTTSAIAVRVDADSEEVAEAVGSLADEGRLKPLAGHTGGDDADAEAAWEVA